MVGRDSISADDAMYRFFETLRGIDQVLLDVEQMAVASRSHSPFNSYLTRLSTEQMKALSDGVSELQTAMLCLVRQEGIKVEAPTVNTAWAIRQSLTQAAEKLVNASLLLLESGEVCSSNQIDMATKLLAQMKSVFAHLDQVLQS